MTVEEKFYPTTETLILSTPRTFYPARIPVNHPQLRSLFSSSSPGIFYYACNEELFRLDIATRKRDYITFLPFSARCLVAGYGWLCVGGSDHGQFAAVRIDDAQPSGEGVVPSRFAEMDSLLPPDLRAHRFLPSLGDRPGSAQRWKPKIIELGGSITNSVTLFQAPLGSAGADDGPVAILSNNDKTVRIFSLLKNRLLTTLDFAIQMNHATIRPDGEMLVAVGDEAYAYFYKRTATEKNHSSWQWELLRKYELTRAPDPTNDGCFATAFSSSGQYCAVASQDGIITIFDTDYVGSKFDDAIIEVLPSSRPHSRCGDGAIRSICFSPAPWDLLICTEQSGRVCVIDMRSGFRSRQLVKLVPKPDLLDIPEIHEVSTPDDLIDPLLRTDSEMEFVRQYRDTMAMRDEAAAADFAADYIEASAERRRLQRQVRNESSQLEASRTSQEREQMPLSVNYQLTRDMRDLSAVLSYAEQELSTTFASTGTNASSYLSRRAMLRERERTTERDSTRSRPYEPHRRNSVVLAGNEPGVGDTGLDYAEAVQISSSMSSQTRPNRSDVWQATEIRASPSILDEDPPPRHQREARRGTLSVHSRNQLMVLELERRNARRLESYRRERLRNLYADVEGTGRQGLDSSRHNDPENYLGTTGCLMSNDGGRLYVGTEDGIFELHVNLQCRKFFPRISLR
ncbi:MAG: hypothetical protein M1816_000094 [Peltula sp. TS41687]|nr:MAG: hypothetical protein M1816_000094 [Peltula sp. TS41687]